MEQQLGVHASEWLEVERYLERKEQELLEKEGVIVPEGHLGGYKYRPSVRLAEKHSWDVLPLPTSGPRCTSEKWSHTEVKFELGEGIACLTLSSPGTKNALSTSVSQALYDATFELHRRTDVRVVVLRAEGSMFCAGGDPRSFAEAAALSDEASSRKDCVNLMKFLYFFQCLPQFTIGLAQGSAMGSGIGLLAVCDIVAAVAAARFAVSEVKLGTCPAAIAPFVTRKVGAANAKRMLCTGDSFTAAEAKRMGLVTDVVEVEADLAKYLESVCSKVTLCAPMAAARAKRLAQNVSQRPLSLKLLEYTGNELANIRLSEEAIKGMEAVQSKTRPSWAEKEIRPLH